MRSFELLFCMLLDVVCCLRISLYELQVDINRIELHLETVPPPYGHVSDVNRCGSAIIGLWSCLVVVALKFGALRRHVHD